MQPHFFAVCLFLSAPSQVDMDAVILMESGGNPKAISRAGARGLCQIMPATWRDHAKPAERWDNPRDNRAVAVRYVNWISKTLKKWGDPNWDRPSHILACYNGGINRFRRRGFDIQAMPRETRDYIRKYETFLRVVKKK